MAGRTVLVIEDDPKIVELLRLYLERDGYRVRTAADGASGLELFARAPADAVILDLMLPRMDGIEVCRRLREASDVPILMLTARVEEVDKLLGLSLGADDYVTKPFSPREVAARIRAILRRTDRGPAVRVLRRGPLVMDRDRHRVTVAGREVPLTKVEFRLLQALLEGPERVYTREALLNRIYDHHEAAVVDRAIDVHVGKLREKLGDDPARPRFIATVRGIGYKLL
ncbi:MAG TPA: response regulator transcription factor [Gemmatimonadales bacterium]|nr:response regulator transcription factor [Gemmatimonadales bacterium]